MKRKAEEEEMSESGFRKHQWVEVKSDEEGFRGAWFIAKILTLPLGSNDGAAAAYAASSASKNRKTLKRRKDEFLVEYKSIMAEERGTKRLREYVHTSCVRPSFPKEPVRLFELNEWVDAFDLDGWWKGVVTKVFENKFKYIVYFKSTEEKMEFLQSDVRVHLEWTDGQWSKPSRQQEIKQDDAEGSKKNGKKRGRLPKVKIPSEQGKVVCKSEETDKRSIRSSKKRRGNATKDKVKDKGSGLKAFGLQASYDADMSITEVLRDIADEPQSPPVTDNKEVASRKNPSVVSTRVLSNIADKYQSPPIIDNKGKLASKSNSAATEEDPPVRTEISRDTADEHQLSPMIDNKATEEDPSVRTEISRDTADEYQSPPIIDNKVTKEDPSSRTEILRDTADEHLSPMIDKKATEEDPSSRTEILRDTADEHQSSRMIDKKEISPDELSQSNKVATKEDTLLKDLEIPESFNLTKSPEEDTCIGTLCSEAIKEQNEMGPASVDNQCKDSREVEKEVTLASVYNRFDDASAKQNQMKESSVNHETRKECNEVHLEAPVIGSTNDKVSVENESLPFVKTLFMWEKILAIEIFRKMPQSPHFRPLKEFNMAQREGMAIGHLITFANVAAKTRASHIDDPRSNLEEISNALVDLEAHGFNVQAIQSRVQRLLEMKDKQLMSEKKSKEAEVKFIELKNVKDKFKTQLGKVKENLRFHEEAIIRYKNEHEVLLKEMDKIRPDTSVCLKKFAESVKLDYSCVAAGLW